MFSKNTPLSTRRSITSISGFKEVKDMGMYLGVPLKVKEWISKPFWATACHKLWLLRNQKIHNQDFMLPTMLAKDIQIASDNYRRDMATQPLVMHQTKFRVHNRWVPAIEGWLTVNTDGAVNNKYIVGYGGII
ncbi:hypothetical protein KIW84_062852 [Lathyrus oleraceus]|uniref:Uncharacterized protein n=1 Tax=Pisum sativum TaxID=3888 RepID=A0A9D4W8J7_PEA|nr:hypothetical protein KIW84_062852 [Pisum sativum]